MLYMEVVEPSQTKRALPIVFVPKKEGNFLFCVEYRKLNAMLTRHSCSILAHGRIYWLAGWCNDFLDVRRQQRLWASRNRRRGPGQESIYVLSRPILFHMHAIWHRNAQGASQRTIEVLHIKVEWRIARAGLDDMVIFSRASDEAIHYVKQVLTLLNDAGVTLHLMEWKLLINCIDNLGHVIRAGHLELLTKQIDAIHGLKHPQTWHNLDYVLAFSTNSADWYRTLPMRSLRKAKSSVKFSRRLLMNYLTTR